MPTARELLEQADALMRRNRERTQQPVDDDIPELTEEVEVEPYSPPAEPPPVVDLRPPLAVLDEIPELTDAVEEIEAPSILELPDEDGEPSRWLEVDRGEVSITGPAPDSIVAVPPATPRPAVRDQTPAAASTPTPVDEPNAAEARFFVEPMTVDGQPDVATPAPDETPIVVLIPPAIETPDDVEKGAAVDASHGIDIGAAASLTDVAPAAASAAVSDATPAAVPVAPPEVVGDAARWDALAEEIRMQVLQRIDIFTDTGLHEQLAARLQPIVDRASADLVATINQQVGQLLRAYVAEAIEREIEKWRQGGV
ncbi:MAG: hypothetical protein ABI886_12150 [Betaproteobacteria bacterium]